MDDSNIWYYLVLGLIYFASKAFGKKKKQASSPNQAPRPVQTEPEQAQPEMSFDELLREITGQKSPKIPPIQQPVFEEEEIVEVQETYFEPSFPAHASDDMDAIAAKPFGYDSPKPFIPIKPRSRLSKDTFERDTKYKIEELEPYDFTQLLRKENGPAQAFVLQEIFARKF
jgi:hypothetical protein